GRPGFEEKINRRPKIRALVVRIPEGTSVEGWTWEVQIRRLDRGRRRCSGDWRGAPAARRSQAYQIKP
ncbi:unnamed protein product, partial [Musa hybrid cultivar]